MTFTAGTSFSGSDLPGSESVLSFPAGEPAGFRVAGPFQNPFVGQSAPGWLVVALVKVDDMSGLTAGNTELMTIGFADSSLVRLWLRNNGILRCSASDGANTVETGTLDAVPLPSGEWCVVWAMQSLYLSSPWVEWGWFPVSGGDGDRGQHDLETENIYVGSSIRAISRAGVRSGVSTDFAIGHLCVFYGTWLPESRTEHLAPLFRPLANAHLGEEARDRIVRVAAESGTFGPAIDVDMVPSSPDMDTAPCGPQPIAASIDIIEDAVEAGQAVLVEHSDDLGLDCMFPESWYNADPAVTLDAEADEISIPFSLSVDIQTDNGGTSANVADDWSSDNLDSWLDHLAENPVKSPTVTVTDWPANFDGGAPGDIFTVENLPAAQLAQRDMTFRVEQVTHTLTRSKWVATINTSSAEPWQNIGVWDDPGSRWDTDIGELYAAISPSDTLLQVVEASFPPATTWGGAAAVPYNVQIDDEIITFATYYGQSLGEWQRFTVIRGVGGTTPAAHPAGAVVHVYPPTRWAY